MSDEKNKTPDFAELLAQAEHQTPESINQAGKDVSPAEINNLSGYNAEYSIEENPAFVSEVIENAQELSKDFEVQDASPAETGQLSPPQQSEIEQAGKAYEGQISANETAPDYAAWIDQQEEQSHEIEASELETQSENQAAARESEYQPTAEDWENYASYLDEQTAEQDWEQEIDEFFEEYLAENPTQSQNLVQEKATEQEQEQEQDEEDLSR